MENAIFAFGKLDIKGNKVIATYDFEGETEKLLVVAFNRGSLLTVWTDGTRMTVVLYDSTEKESRERFFRLHGASLKRWYEKEVLPSLN